MNRTDKIYLCILILAFGFIWADLIRRLGSYWSTNPQYAFGWSVPLLSMLLLRASWLTRPPASPPQSHRPAMIVGAALALCLLPLQVILEATPDWRPVAFALAVCVVCLSLCAVYLIGGGPWVKHFIFPVAFILTSVPWPAKIEQPFIQHLTATVTVFTVNGLGLFHIPAIRHGNLIEISTGVIGVEEACSGVRSFQATLMASLFLGQLINLTWRQRALLVGAGLSLAFGCNVLRTFALSVVAQKRGIAELEKWHDSAGLAILFVTVAGLIGLSYLFRTPAIIAVPKSNRLTLPLIPRAPILGLCAWIIVCVISLEWWFHSSAAGSGVWWHVDWPTAKSGFEDIPFSQTERDLLGFDFGRKVQWEESDLSQWMMFFFRWRPGAASSRILARYHRPEICLSQAGLRLVSESSPEMLPQGPVKLAFRTYVFEQKEKRLYVFFCIWDDRRQPSGALVIPPAPWTLMGRKESVLNRERNLGQQVLEIAVSGVSSEREARLAFERVIPPLIRLDTRTDPAEWSSATRSGL